MNYTKNYRLPQWVKEDRIMMDDFNAMNSSIENGLTKTAAQAASAVSTANEAKTEAFNKPYVTGTYVATGEEQTITLGFRPAFLIFSGMQATAMDNTTLAYDRYFGMTAGNVLKTRVRITDTGFTVLPRVTNSAVAPNFADSGRRYDYIAFK